MNHTRSQNQTLRGALVGVAIVAALGVASMLGKAGGFFLALALLLTVSAVLTPRASACFANNFGALNNTTLFHDAFAEFWQFLLPVTRIALNVANEVTLDNGQTVLVRNAKPGDTVTIKNWKQAFNVYTVGTNGYNSPTDITPADRTFTLPNTAKAVSIQLTPAEFRVIASGVSGGADYDAFKTKIVNGMLHSVGAAVVADFLALLTAANYPNETVSAAGTFDGSKELAIEKAFYDRAVPLDRPQIVLNSTAFLEYVNSFVTQQNYTGQQTQKPLLFMGERQSTITPFSLQRTQVGLPADADRGAAILRTGVLGAFRIPDEPTWEGDPVSLTRVIDSRKNADGVEVGSGIGALVRMWKVGGGSTGAMQLDIASIWKFEKGQPEAVQRLVSEATD